MSQRYLQIRAVVLALALFGVGVMIYQDIVEAETTGTSRPMNGLLVIAYDIAGKWGVMVVWTIVSCAFVWLTLRWKPKGVE
jgi:hypothetical protein